MIGTVVCQGTIDSTSLPSSGIFLLRRILFWIAAILPSVQTAMGERATAEPAVEPADFMKAEKGNVLLVSEETREVTRQEHGMGILEALTTYPKIVLWCMFLCLPIIGIQYDQTVMGAFYALPAFQQRYGRARGGKWVIEAQWQSAISMAGYLGQIFGALGVAAYPGSLRPSPYPLGGGALASPAAYSSSSSPSPSRCCTSASSCRVSSAALSSSSASRTRPSSHRWHCAAFFPLMRTFCAVVGQFLGTGVTIRLPGPSGSVGLSRPVRDPVVVVRCLLHLHLVRARVTRTIWYAETRRRESH